MPPRMTWLVFVLRLATAPLFFGALILGLRSGHTVTDLGAGVALVVLGVIQLLSWSQPWPIRSQHAATALGAMVLPIALLQHVFHVPQPLLWLYPAIIAGAGLSMPLSAILVGLMALAAVFPVVPAARSGMTVMTVLGSTHTILLSIVLAGLGMAAARQLILVNADLQESKAELAELAVARERERLARDLHDLLGRTLSLIAVKAELATRLSAGRAPAAEAELREVQQLARAALRDVREALTAYRTPTIAAELAAARLALQSAGIEASVTRGDVDVTPAHEAALAWAVREAVTNVIQHSSARQCWITLERAAGVTTLAVVDDGSGPGGASGSGLRGLAERIQALGGTIEAGPAGLQHAERRVPDQERRARGPLWTGPSQSGASEDGRGGFRVRVTIPVPARELEAIQ